MFFNKNITIIVSINFAISFVAGNRFLIESKATAIGSA